MKMKTIFIINPKAGKGKRFKYIISEIAKLSAKTDEDIEVYTTKAPYDAARFVAEYCEKNGAARFIACGGDGTFSEVLNGAIGFKEAEIGVLPIGTGNDFCRNFDDSEGFLNVEAQIFGKCIKCDAIKYKTQTESGNKSGYCANMFNIGFDCAVADTTGRVKEKTFFSGPFAYLVSIFINLIKKNSYNLKIEIDGEPNAEKELLLTSVANGSYCGGGLYTNPLATVNDGSINLNIVNNISRLGFLRLLPCYINGTYLKRKGIEKIVSSKKCKNVKITPQSENMLISIDGEISRIGETEFEIIHNAFNFVLPSAEIKTERTGRTKALA